ncbi:MAG: methyltransferase [Coriobacteriia bacterium]|nr:methyltransferase [Coriobacteriia bacterium]
MTSRERVQAALEHRTPDRTPRDFGSTAITGIAASLVFRLRQALGLPEKPIKIFCPYQMLGEVDEDLRRYLGVDAITAWPLGNLFGFDNTPVKPFTLFDGTPVLVPEAFNTTPEPDGKLFQYACGDRSYPPSCVMPQGGLYFDSTVRVGPIEDEEALNPVDNLEEFTLLDDDTLKRIEQGIREVYDNTQYAIVGGGPGGTGLGDIAFVPGPMMPNPKGVRDIADWYMSSLIRPDYIKEVFDRQTDIALKNLELYHQAVGERIAVITLCGADFGNQRSLMLSPDLFKELYVPYYQKMTSWIHAHTQWKVFKHCCGAIEPLLPHLIAAGFDIINPVQISAAGMDSELLKQKYGDDLVFWGGGVDTQGTLPYGTPQEVYQQVKEQVRILGRNGGFIFNTVHNAQADVPVENFLAMIEALDG